MSSEKNPVNFKKLPGSKWTATEPQNKEKHFIVLGWEIGTDGEPTDRVEVEAVYSGSIRRVNWRELADRSVWLVGWS